jgi:hypothetical protein
MERTAEGMKYSRGWKSGYAANRPKRLRKALRKTRLSALITPERIATFVAHLLAVSIGEGSECWFYVGCGKGTTLPTDVNIRTTTYANVKFNRETVGPHQFALAASEGITLSELAGFDVHHAAEFGRCIGYRCCNPDHLEKLPRKDHDGTQGDKGSLVRFQIKAVKEIIGVPESRRRPDEFLRVTGAGVRRRFLAGQPFLIRGGVLENVI